MGVAPIVVLALIVALVVAGVLIYNRLVQARNTVDEAWSGMDVQLKRRHDLVPNLVETVKGFAAQEREVLERTTAARSAAMSASSTGETARAEARLSSALGGIRAVAEAYPELRCTEGFQRLQAQLAEIEDEIQAARRIYNANVAAYNTAIQVFPSVLVAGPGGFTAREYFEIEVASERAAPTVRF